MKVSSKSRAICALFASASFVGFASMAQAQTDGMDIIVTAQKRSQSLQDVSVAVSAVSGDALTNAGINNLQDIQQLVPSVTFGNDFN